MDLASENVEFQEHDDVSDEEVDNSKHKKLVLNLASMCNKQRINLYDNKRLDTNQQLKKTHAKDEDGNGEGGTLFKGVLRERVTLREIKLKVPARTNKQIKKSLEKIDEDKIKRVVGYKNVKKDLNKWSSIVERNKLAPQLTFPILEKKVENKTSYDFLTTFKEPTELEKEMAKVLNISVIAQEERKQERELSKLPIEEMIKRRKLAGKMRARESYRISKAIRQNKIKSKKYHRILKKEKIKQELKDFERLQMTDPEAAVEKLEQIERARAEERISLRHKNTGKWARSKAIRAKYDTEARIQLAEQLAKSKELTRKVKAGEDSTSEDETFEEEGTLGDDIDKIINTSKNNNDDKGYIPWVSGFKRFTENYEMSTQEIPEQNNTSKVHDNHEDISLEKENFDLSESEEDEPQMDLNNLNNAVEHQKLPTELQENCDGSEEEDEPQMDLKNLNNAVEHQKLPTELQENCDGSEEEDEPQMDLKNLNNAVEHQKLPTELRENCDGSEEEDEPQMDLNNLNNAVEHQKLPTELQENCDGSEEEDEPQMDLNNLNNAVEHQKLPTELQENCDGSEEEDEMTSSSKGSNDDSQCKQIKNKGSIWEVTEIKHKNQGGSSHEDIIEGTSSGEKDSSESNQNLSASCIKNISLHEMFEEAEDIIQELASEQLKKFKLGLTSDNNLEEKQAAGNKKESRKYEFKQQTKLHDIDAALIEVAVEGISSGQNDLRELKEKLNSTSENKKEKESQIDINKTINAKPQELSAELPDYDESGDFSEEEGKGKQLNLIEAFAEADIVSEFRNEKKEEAKASKGKEIDLSLPGWGSWGGTGLVKTRRKNRRFFVKIQKIPRKDEKKPNVIINEDPIPKLRHQLVSELPYPFTSVKDFEASIRAPIGKHWVSEKGFKKLTAPAVLTKMGTIIEPMSSSMLADMPIEKKRPNNTKQEVKFKKRKIQK